jgi:hypothetical protein
VTKAQGLLAYLPPQYLPVFVFDDFFILPITISPYLPNMLLNICPSQYSWRVLP